MISALRQGWISMRYIAGATAYQQNGASAPLLNILNGDIVSHFGSFCPFKEMATLSTDKKGLTKHECSPILTVHDDTYYYC